LQEFQAQISSALKSSRFFVDYFLTCFPSTHILNYHDALTDPKLFQFHSATVDARCELVVLHRCSQEFMQIF